jgi:farnesyl diphosphate synthase
VPFGKSAVPTSNESSFQHALEAIAAKVDARLEEMLPVNGTRLRDAIRYAVLSPGKRLRALLVIESAGIFDSLLGDPVRVAAALECLHSYSLVHDDLPAMDNDDLRRGQPTVHREFDEATAILVGDALQTLAFEMLAHPRTHPEALVRSQLVLHLATAAGEAGMVGGQMLDIEAETRNFASLAEISAMQSGKTGALFRFACQSGAIMAQEDTTALRQFADHLGVAFQIADDILDVESTPEALGKATQKDKSKGKATFIDFLGLDAAKLEAKRLSDAAIAALEPYGSRADMLRDAARFVITRRK